MKAVCINNSPLGNESLKRPEPSLTVGKIYELKFKNNMNDRMVDTINDKGKEFQYLSNRFKLLREYREQKLKRILSIS
jgi:hypothetical protein